MPNRFRSFWTQRGLGWIGRVAWFSWLALLFLLPITSQPQLVAALRGGIVAPASVVPLVLVAVFGMAPYFWRGGKLPSIVTVLILFALAAMVATILAPWLGVAPFKDQDVVARGLRALSTLAIGIGFYLAAVVLPSDDPKLRTSLKWISLGAVPMLLWSTVQLLRLPYANDPIPPGLDAIHAIFSPRAMYRDRITGFAYEPSWLADQLVVLYLPIWLGCLLQRCSAFGSRKSIWSVELGLLVWGLVILAGTFSRVGLAAWFLVALFLAGVGGWKAASWLSRWRRRRIPGYPRPLAPGAPIYLPLASSALGVILVLASAGLLLRVVGRLDERVADIFTLDLSRVSQSPDTAWFEVANQLSYAERVMYWTSASRVFALHPILGVGLGNSGFYMTSVMPAFGYKLPEVLDALKPGVPDFPNPKSIWFRLLAETGLVGFVLFISWLIVQAAVATTVIRRSNGPAKAMGLAAILALLAFVVEGFSLDSFALPYLWITLGLVSSIWARIAVPGNRAVPGR